MKGLFIAAACAVCATAATAEVTVSFANGTEQTFTSVTAFAMNAGNVLDETLGRHDTGLRPGQSATIPLNLTTCQPVFLQAVWGDGIAATEADACDTAIFTLTE